MGNQIELLEHHPHLAGRRAGPVDALAAHHPSVESLLGSGARPR